MERRTFNMKSNKLFISLATLAVVGGFAGLSSCNTSYDAGLLSGKSSYLVELKDNSASTRYSFKAKMDKTFGVANYTITDTFEGSLFNGYAVTFNSSYKNLVKSFDVVEDVIFNQTYGLPDTQATDTEIGIGDDSGKPTDTDRTTTSYSRATMRLQDTDIEAPKKQGDGMTIGIMDTGLYANQVAVTADDKYDEKAFRPITGEAANNVSRTKEDMDEVKNTAGTHGTNAKYVNNKIIWEYDYADNDNNVNTTTSNAHGTHVASLAAANGKTYEGAAPNAQLAIMKVFSDNSSGATSNALLHAFQDAANLKLDVINLSLGSALFQVDNSESDREIYKLVNKLEAAGTQVNFAAGNDGRASYARHSGFFADTITLDTVEPSEFGSYALLSSPNIIASSFLDKSYHKKLIVGNRSTSFTDQNTDYPIDNLFESTTEYKYIYIGGAGEESEYNNILQGKTRFEEPTIAVVNRGDISFVEKATNAQHFGAKALIIVNNQAEDGGRFNLTTGATEPITIPVVSVPKTTGQQTFGSAGTSEGKVSYDKNGKLEDNDSAKMMSYFSSDGPATNLNFNPDITAPGTDILGAINGEYGTMSGTSMATPNFSGAMATLLSNNPGTTDEEKQAYTDHIMARIESTATPLHDDSLLQISSSRTKKALDDNGQVIDKNIGGAWDSKKASPLTGKEDFAENSEEYNYASPRRSGAGMINVEGALNNKVWLESQAGDSTESNIKGDGSAKIQLGYNDGNNDANIDLTFITHNETETAQTYDVKLYVAVPEARLGILGSDIETSGIDTSMLAKGLPTTYMQSTDDHMVAFDTIKSVTVQPGDSLLNVQKDYSKDSYLTDYVNEYYSDGTYLEGYVVLEPTGTTAANASTDTTLRIPYIKFYGDYSKASAAEKFDFERTDDSTLNSDVMASVAHNISGGKPNADFGSQIYATDYTSYLKDDGSLDTYNVNDHLNKIAAGSKTLEDFNFAKLGTDTNGELFEEGKHDGVYAGVEGKSDLLVVKQFMNRSCYNGKVTLKDASGKTLQTGWLRDYIYSSSDDSNDDEDMLKNDDPANNGYQLLKSFVTESFISSGYYVAMATVAIPMKDASGDSLPAGDYTLQFDYKLFAKKSSTSTENITQTKSVKVTVPEKASNPTIRSYGRLGNFLVIYVSDDTKYVRFPANDKNNKTSSVASVVNYKSSTEITRYVLVPTSAIVNGYVRGTAVGQDGQSTEFLIDTKGDGNYGLIGNKLDNIEMFSFQTQIDDKASTIRFNMTVLGKNGKTYTAFTSSSNHGAIVHLPAGTEIKKIEGITTRNKQDVYTEIDASNYIYDKASGQLTVKLPARVSSFVIHY